MRYLFCTDVEHGDDKPAEAEFLTQEAPQSLADSYERAAGQLIDLAGKHSLPTLFVIIEYVSLLIAGMIIIGLLRSDVSFAEGYGNAPYLYWICGIAAVIFLVLRGMQWTKERKFANSEGANAAANRVDAADRSINDYLNVPADAENVDVLVFPYSMSGGVMTQEDQAEYSEVKIFTRDDNLCVLFGFGLYSFPLAETDGIKLLRQGLAMDDSTWNKDDSETDEIYKKAGVVQNQGLSFYCALDIERGGETCRLCFPAYELDAFSALTGFAEPELPAVTFRDKIAKKGSGDFADEPVEKIKPEFYWHYPRQKGKSLFRSNVDMQFKTRHPKEYAILMTIILIAMFAPMIIYFIVMVKIPGYDRSIAMIIGLLGSLCVGGSFASIVGAWMKQYMGHIATALLFLVGTAMLVGSYLMVVG